MHKVHLQQTTKHSARKMKMLHPILPKKDEKNQ